MVGAMKFFWNGGPFGDDVITGDLPLRVWERLDPVRSPSQRKNSSIQSFSCKNLKKREEELDLSLKN